MKILAIESSCDDTSIAYIDVHEATQTVTVLSHITSSQADLHTQYGGVFPMIAKREHAKNIVPILKQVLIESNEYTKASQSIDEKLITDIPMIDPGMAQELCSFLQNIEIPKIDYICVTYGPGLEMSLWVGVNFATALSNVWGIPLVPVNHMEGHIYSISANGQKEFPLHNFTYPYLSLLISGGHTQLVLAPNKDEYKIIGNTKDDAVGEAFDKVARMIDLPYPGGPAISKIAKNARAEGLTSWVTLPRPMMHSSDMDFSFSGIKTAVMYAIEKKVTESGPLSEQDKMVLAMEFENAVTEVVVKKLFKAVDEYQIEEISVAGGVAANTYIQEQIKKHIEKEGYNTRVYFPDRSVTGDNALMIALVGYKNIQEIISGNKKTPVAIKANGSLRLSLGDKTF